MLEGHLRRHFLPLLVDGEPSILRVLLKESELIPGKRTSGYPKHRTLTSSQTSALCPLLGASESSSLLGISSVI